MISYANNTIQKNLTSPFYTAPYHAINNITDWHLAPVLQPYTHFETLFNHAYLAQTDFNRLMHKIAAHSQSEVILPGQKSHQRALEKITTELHGNTQALTDLIRGSIVAADLDTLLTAYHYIIQYTDVCDIKNRFRHPAESGYRDIKILIRLPDTHLIAEIQLHLHRISSIKNGVEHAIYEKIQKIERRAILESRSLYPLEKKQITLLRQRSQQLYQSVWQHYIDANKLAS